MKIKVLDGSIAFHSGTFVPWLDRRAFLETSLGQQAQQELVNKEWWHLRIRPEPGINADILYRGDLLYRMDIQMELPSDSTSEWTEARELERKALHDDWLQSEIGEPPYEYPWGKILSVYDAKGCVSEIIVVYGR